MNNEESIKIYEVLYGAGQSPTCADVQPFSIDNSNPEWRELQAYLDVYNRGLYESASFTGVFSPKFSLKAKVQFSEFLKFVKGNMGSDVCFLNPFPQISYWSFNVWMQGEYAHPGLMTSAQNLLNAVGIPWDIKNVPRHGYDNLSYSNFWVGSSQFWDIYVGSVLKPIALFLKTEPSNFACRQVLKPTSHTDPAPYLPFIIERLFSTFLSLNQDVSFISYPIDMEDIIKKYCLNEYEKLLVCRMEEEITNADLEKRYSPELLTRMDVLTCMHQQHFLDYYRWHKHPHTGKLVI